MARSKLKFILGAAILADLAMTAAVFVKTCLPSEEELVDGAVEDAWEDLERKFYGPIGFNEDAPADSEACDEVIEHWDDVGAVVRDDTEPRKRDPIDEGIDNILRYEVKGVTGFESE